MISFFKPTIRELEIRQTLLSLINDNLEQETLLKAFNEKIRHFINTPLLYTVFSLEIALLTSISLLNIESGDEVILSSITPISFYNAILLKNAIPILVDVDEKTYLPNFTQVQNAITEKTKAIMVFTPFFYTEEMFDFLSLGIPIIYDITTIFGCKELSFPQATDTPFIVLNALTHKDLITTLLNGCNIAFFGEFFVEKVQSVFTPKTDGFYLPLFIGEVAAAMGIEQLNRLEEFILIRQNIAYEYESVVKEKSLIKDPKNSTYLYYPFWIEGYTKEELTLIFEKNGVQVLSAINKGLHTLMGLEDEKFIISQKLVSKMLCLPIYPTLSSGDVKLIKTIFTRLF